MAARQLPLPGSVVKKSNTLCRARWAPEAIWEARLVAIVASKIKQGDKEFQTYEISVMEILGGHKGGEAYKLIDKATDYAMTRILKLETDTGWAKYHLFSACIYNEKAGTITVRFDPGLKPHYIELKKRFAQYSLFEFMLLPSTYSQRIFEILKSWDDKPEITVNLDELHEMIDAPESMRQNFGEFRRRVLEKAHKDISGKTSLVYEWEAVKKGRAVVAVRFVFNEKRAGKVQAKRKAAGADKVHEGDNKLFLDVMKCFADLGGDCREHLSEKACAHCRNINGRQQSLPFGEQE